MKDFLFLMEFRYVILIAWFLISLWGLYISTYRSLIDRVRAGITPVPNNDNTNKLLSSLLAAPNHQRPYHIESAFLSSIQIILGTIAFSCLLKTHFAYENAGWVLCIGLSFIIAFLWERAWIGIASQSLAVIRELGLNPEIVNVNGGAIALGHPLGCTGGKLTVQLINEMKRRNQKYGMVTMCVGAGQGAAGVFEIL